MRLNEKAILVAPVLRKWNPRKSDKLLASEITDKYGIKSEMVSTSRKLVSIKESSFKSLETIDKNIRNHCFYSVGQGCTGFCVPYDGKGWHILPTELQEKFIARFNGLKDQRESVVKNIINGWSDILEEAKKELKELFNPLDYPSKDELIGLYECDYKDKSLDEEAYIGKGDDKVFDVRHGVSDNETAEVRGRERSSIALATEQASTKMGVLLTHLTDCLKEDKTFRDKSFSKVQDAIEEFGAWNFNNDEQLEEVGNILKEAITNIDVDDLRKDKDKTDKFVEASDKAIDILDNLKGLI
tara:strand:+ start:232 stop:1128 length:897 start_codon:yes stop_codon:yes gene_type:complete